MKKKITFNRQSRNQMLEKGKMQNTKMLEFIIQTIERKVGNARDHFQLVIIRPHKTSVYRCLIESVSLSVCLGARPGGLGTGIFDTFFFQVFAFFLHVLGYFNTLRF